MIRSYLLVALLFFQLVPQQGMSFDVPTLRAPVTDQAQLLSRQTHSGLNHLIKDFQFKTGNQIAILTLKSLHGDAIESISIQITDKWKLGSEKKDNGLLLLIAKKEQKVRIEVGQGLEGVITDLFAKRVIDQVITPHFKSRDFDTGVINAVYTLMLKIEPKYKINTPSKPKVVTAKKKESLIGLIFKGIFFIFMAILFIKNPMLFLLLLSGSGRSRHGGGGFSGGGGGFSGGGASGGW